MSDNAYGGILCHRQPVICRPPPQNRSLPTFLLVPKHRKTGVTSGGQGLCREITDKRAEVGGMEGRLSHCLLLVREPVHGRSQTNSRLS
jgi:hypothetical protein